MERRYAPLIDLVRCAAALMVALFHLGTRWPAPNKMPILLYPDYPDYGAFDHLFYWGWVGVEIFFVISGYVIAGSSVGRTARAFFVGRGVRLLPLLWVAATLSLLVQIGQPGLPLLYLKTLVLFPIPEWIDVVIWTLVVEVTFYMTVGALILLARDMRRALLILAHVLTIASLMTLSAEHAFGKASNWLPTLFLLRHGAFFALGIFIWAGMRPFALISVATGVFEIVGMSLFRNAQSGHALPVIVPVMVWLLAVGLIWLGARRTSPTVAPWIRTVGLMTYPIYLIHHSVGGLLVHLAARAMPPVPALAVGILGVAMISWALVRFVEPAIRPFFTAALSLPFKLADRFPVRTA